ncbi:DNA cytosine methyltransferase [uncultured Desulfovibrio sp.]|uniref:DNA cytosine methyltransferase n=1 Tax=uncultured Desulfovibrio sp. TaxID=167968 RepID=UPI00260F372E|nr:DNA cytosine methyltransferase [uncultured Desulfovibrio sp.]
MRYLSLCSGIEAASVAWEPLGWQPVGFCEIEAFPSAVLAHHYPSVPNFGDMTRLEGEDFHGMVEIIVAGTPCQGFSIAGGRQGLDDERSGLAMHYALAWRAHGGSRWTAIHGEGVMRPQQRKSHPHRILPPALHRQQLRAALRRGLEAEARAVREYMRECETEQRKTKYLVLAFWTVYCLLFLSIPLILS